MNFRLPYRRLEPGIEDKGQGTGGQMSSGRTTLVCEVWRNCG
jgi:hypothetical protein